MVTTILEVSREADLASKLSEDTPDAIGFATPCWCHTPRRAKESVTQSYDAAAYCKARRRHYADAALPNLCWA